MAAAPGTADLAPASKRRWLHDVTVPEVAPRVVIVGGGIAGLAAALSLEARGVTAEVFEQSDAIRELGVGLNVLPPAVQCLSELGLLPVLDRVGIRTNELIMANRQGQHIWRDLRGLGGGHPAPQLSIHRGRLQRVLYDAVGERLGYDAVHVDRRLVDVEDGDGGPVASFVDRTGTLTSTAAADVVLGADGIHSTLRAAMYPSEGPPHWNGAMAWRGATEWPVFLDGRSMIVAGGTAAKAVVYPIGPGSSVQTRLTNWAMLERIAEDGDTPPRPEDWSRLADRGDVERVLGHFSIREVDLPGLVSATSRIFEYPMCDRDPIPAWTRGRVTLIGDAAHPMYPMGSNGATQAIIDARCLAGHLAGAAPDQALGAYEDERRPVTSEIVRRNRLGGPEGIIDLVEERAPHGFTDLDAIIGPDELRCRLDDYMRLTAGRAEEPGRISGSARDS
jgi:2-polyprenyl-6-methoxyphenol hydroxylase-like FAD-dependent oxidoreductase